jgi:NAD+ diphosphatase
MNERFGVPHVFAGNPMDRGEVVRRDEEWLTAQASDPASLMLPMWQLNVPVSAEHALTWLNAEDIRRLNVDSEPIFLGLHGGRSHFVVDVSAIERGDIERDGLSFEDARTTAEYMSGPDSGIVAQARAQLSWHGRHGFCAVCGHPTSIARGGQVRRCSGCSTEHYPRTDPVVITVVHDGDRCLLGQSRGRLVAMRRYSALAGFMDQGECIEEAVAREVMEEAGIQVGAVRYHSSQPWPFPSSLMIGCHADAATTDIHFDPEEMADVQWFSRDEVLLSLNEKSEILAVPGPTAIAHHLIRSWANGDVE